MADGGGKRVFAMTADKARSLPFDTSVAHQARMYDYVLGGKDNFEADREAVEAWLKVDPSVTRRASPSTSTRTCATRPRSSGRPTPRPTPAADRPRGAP
jgi:hypothetical protein